MPIQNLKRHKLHSSCPVPPVGWVKLNIDCSVCTNSERAGARGALWGENGNWIRGCRPEAYWLNSGL